MTNSKQLKYHEAQFRLLGPYGVKFIPLHRQGLFRHCSPVEVVQAFLAQVLCPTATVGYISVHFENKHQVIAKFINTFVSDTRIENYHIHNRVWIRHLKTGMSNLPRENVLCRILHPAHTKTRNTASQNSRTDMKHQIILSRCFQIPRLQSSIE